MVSTELASRILLTVTILGFFSINNCRAAEHKEKISLQKNIGNEKQPNLSNDSLVPSASELADVLTARSFKSSDDVSAETRLLPDSAEAGILLPFEEEFPRSGESSRGFPSNDFERSESPSSYSFSAKPLALRVSSGKSLKYPNAETNTRKGSMDDHQKSTYFLRNNCFGPRCVEAGFMSSTVPSSSLEDWRTVYYNNKEIKAKKYDGGNVGPGRRLELDDNMMESMSSNYHSQLAVPFIVVDDGRNSIKGPMSFSRRNGVGDRFTRTTTTTTSTSPPGWVKLKPLSPDAYDPFNFARNFTIRDTERSHPHSQSTFSKRNSANTVNFSKRVGVELSPDSFADRWGWSSNGEHDKRGGGGSRLPAWLEEQLKYGTRNSDQNKNWVKLDPIPVAGVTISKWVPKGTHSSELPTTSWQTNRDRPNAGPSWWDRIDENRILGGNRPASSSFLRPEVEDSYSPPPQMTGGWGGSKGSSLSSLDRYPTNSWNDIVYPDGPLSATVSWQQNKGVSNYPSSFSTSSSASTGWSSTTETRKPIVATGSWSAPPNTRFPSFINRFSDHHPSSYPAKQASEDDPRWVLISNSRRVALSKGHEHRQESSDRNKIPSWLHPDINRNDFPFREPHPPHRHGKDLWPYQHGTQDEAFHRVNATLSTLTPVLIHRGGTTVRPPIVNTIRPNPSDDGESYGFSSSTISPVLSSYFGDGRATSSNADLQLQSSTTTPLRSNLSGKIRQGLKNINPVYAAVGAGMIPATLAAVMPMVLGRRRRDTLSQQNVNNYPNVLLHLRLPNQRHNSLYSTKLLRYLTYADGRAAKL